VAQICSSQILLQRRAPLLLALWAGYRQCGHGARITLSLEPYTTLRTPFLYAAILINHLVWRHWTRVLAVTLATLALGYYFRSPNSRHSWAAESRRCAVHPLFSRCWLFSSTWVSAKRKGVERRTSKRMTNWKRKFRERTSDLQRANRRVANRESLSASRPKRLCARRSRAGAMSPG